MRSWRGRRSRRCTRRCRQASAGNGWADGDDGAGDVVGGFAAEEGGEGDEIFWMAEPAAWIVSGDALDVVVADDEAHARRAGEPGAMAVVRLPCGACS